MSVAVAASVPPFVLLVGNHGVDGDGQGAGGAAGQDHRFYATTNGFRFLRADPEAHRAWSVELFDAPLG